MVLPRGVVLGRGVWERQPEGGRRLYRSEGRTQRGGGRRNSIRYQLSLDSSFGTNRGHRVKPVSEYDSKACERLYEAESTDQQFC
jgi:hypothetical protein